MKKQKTGFELFTGKHSHNTHLNWGGIKKQKMYRDIQILKSMGISGSTLGKVYGISRQRVHQILKWG